MLGSARFVGRRMSEHLGVLLTATLSALVTAVLLVSATILAPGVAGSALDRTLAGAGPDDATLSASTGLDEQWPELDDRLRAAVDEAGVIEDVTATMTSTAFTAPGIGDDVRLAVGHIEDVGSTATLSEGRWPRAGATTVEVAVHTAALGTLGVGLGDVVEVRPLTGDTEPVELTVVGAYVPAAPDDAAWRGYGAGVRPAQGNSFTVIGPILTERDDLLHRVAPSTATATWLLPLARTEVTLGNAGRTVTELRSLDSTLSDLRAGDTGQQLSVTGDAAGLVERASAAASSTRALLLVVVAMLTVLGGWALVFTARLVAARRATASALLRARGGTERQMLWWSVLAALPPAAVVALAAPPLARIALRPVRDSIDDPGGPLLGWLTGLAVAAGWLVLVVVADLRAGRSVTEVATERARPRRAAAQRAGLDVALLALGTLGLQQLRRPVEDAPEIVLVLAPALVVLAGTVILVRALPWVARGVADITTAGPGAGAMLGAQETARRTTRHVAAGILVVLAITVSVFAATTQSTWDAFRTDTVDLAEPADVRLEVAAGETSDVEEIEAQIHALPGVERAMRVVRTEFRDGDTSVDVVGVDTAHAAAILRWHRDLAGGDPADRLDLLRADDAPGTVPVLATAAFADRLGLSTGDEIALDLGGTDRSTVRIAGLVDAVAGSPEPAALIADTATLSAELGQVMPDEWWLATSDDGRAAADAAAGIPEIAAAAPHADAVREATDDPSAAGVVAGLTAGLAFAAVFVLIGVVAHTITSFQSRSTEYALLRAIGQDRRSVAGQGAVEHGVLLGFATLAGLGLGLVVAWLVVPHAVGGLTGLPAVPPLRLAVPWPTVAAMSCSIVVLAAVLISVQTALTRRLDVAAVGREGT